MDPDNILQTLMGGAQGASNPTNVLQGMDTTFGVTTQPQAALPGPEEVAQAATDASPPVPRKRASLVDILGHLADGIAQAGGATPMYQHTLDAMQAHDFADQNQKRQITADTIRNATDKFNLSNSQTEAANSERERFASVLGAINDSEDAGNMPALMSAAGLTDPRYAPFVKMVQDDPETAKTLASALGGGEGADVGKQIRTGYDSKGNRVAYVVDGEGNPHILSGVTPDDTFKVVNTGGKTEIIGANGQPKTILPNTVSPNTAATVGQSDTNNKRTTATALTIAGMPARAKDASAPGKASDPAAGLKIISDIQQSFDNLHNLQALPGEGGAVGNLVGAVGRTALGQAIEAKTGISAAAQEREILAKNLANLQSDLIKSLPGNATRTRFEQEIQKKRLPDPNTMNYATANRAIAQIRDAYSTALRSQPASTGVSKLPMLSPADAAKLAPGTHFRTLDGRELVRH